MECLLLNNSLSFFLPPCPFQGPRKFLSVPFEYVWRVHSRTAISPFSPFLVEGLEIHDQGGIASMNGGLNCEPDMIQPENPGSSGAVGDDEFALTVCVLRMK